jgi:hypothetical protein
MDKLVDEHHMPAIEAVLAGTLALMTGYSQFLQAAANPAHRLCMGEKIAHNLALLAEHPRLSLDCRCVLWQLQQRWNVMTGCTLQAGACSAAEASSGTFTLPRSTTLQ